jgi:hypothetical protein
LQHFVRAIVETVSANPPFATLGAPRASFRQSRVPFAVLQRDSERLIADANASIGRAFEKKIERTEHEGYAKTGQEIERLCGRAIGALKQKLGAIRELPVELDPMVEREIEMKAKVEAYGEAQAGLSNSYGRRELSFDQYMKATRELAKMHFQNTLFEVLNN